MSKTSPKAKTQRISTDTISLIRPSRALSAAMGWLLAGQGIIDIQPRLSANVR